MENFFNDSDYFFLCKIMNEENFKFSLWSYIFLTIWQSLGHSTYKEVFHSMHITICYYRRNVFKYSGILLRLEYLSTNGFGLKLIVYFTSTINVHCPLFKASQFFSRMSLFITFLLLFFVFIEIFIIMFFEELWIFCKYLF